MARDKQQFGQYMTPPLICNFMVGLIEHDHAAAVLEPSCGTGAFLTSLESHGFTNVTSFEIDKSLINSRYTVRNESFVSSPTTEKFDVIIGNPPYIRWKNLEDDLKAELDGNVLWNRYCNSLCDYSNIFIIKAIEQLNDGGELIFITPEYWISTTHAQSLRNFMLDNGILKELYHFNETPIFKDVRISLVVFKFIKTARRDVPLRVVKCPVRKQLTDADIAAIKAAPAFEIPQFRQDERWLLADEAVQRDIARYEASCNAGASENRPYATIGDCFDIGNGMVSGLDRAFQLPDELILNENEKAACLDVLKAKHLTRFAPVGMTRYLLINTPMSEGAFKKAYPHFYAHLKPHETKLKQRYCYGRDIPWWEWVFLRNYALFSSGKDKIFVPCKERITNKDRFRFCLAAGGVFPTQDVTALIKKDGVREDARYVLALLNSRYVFEWLSHKGIRKGDIVEFSEKPVASIPFRRIRFDDAAEKAAHDRIVSLVDAYIASRDERLLADIDAAVDSLM